MVLNAFGVINPFENLVKITDPFPRKMHFHKIFCSFTGLMSHRKPIGGSGIQSSWNECGRGQALEADCPVSFQVPPFSPDD